MNLIKWIKRKSILKKRIIIFEKQLKNAMDINDRCMDFDCRCNRVKFMDGFVVFQEHTNENDVTLAIIPKENILFIATE